jgi:transposase
VRVSQSVWQVRDELWEVIQPLSPEHPRDPRGGRPRVDDRVCFSAIMFVLFTGIAWRHLPPELGCSPATAHRRLREWQRAGLFARCIANCCASSTAPGGSTGRRR